jgi:L-threonylcarbamoyladenylate synthase
LASIGADLEIAGSFLKNGELVAIPTETVYGLAGNAFDEQAVLSIFKVKNRPSFDPLIVHTDTVEKLGGFITDFPEKAQALAHRFWPGPLTLLLRKSTLIPDLVTSGLDQVAVRIPDHPLTLSLLSKLDFPLAAPSANPFGYISPTNASHVNEQLGDSIPYILDGGEAGIGIESTIIGFVDEKPVVYRLGGLALEEIELVVGEVEQMPHSTSNPKAPGMLKSHYAPRKPFFLKNRAEIEQPTNDAVHYLLFNSFLEGQEVDRQRLFAYLRTLDKLPGDAIWAELVPDTGLGRAINDRLRRAAALAE